MAQCDFVYHINVTFVSAYFLFCLNLNSIRFITEYKRLCSILSSVLSDIYLPKKLGYMCYVVDLTAF